MPNVLSFGVKAKSYVRPVRAEVVFLGASGQAARAVSRCYSSEEKKIKNKTLNWIYNHGLWLINKLNYQPPQFLTANVLCLWLGI
jgi:hypothetical protein